MLISASRGAAAPSRHRCDSFPSDKVVGGFFFDFELFRTASGPSRRVRETAVASMASSREIATTTPSLDPTRVYVVIRTPSTRCHIGPSRATAMLRAGTTST